MMSLLFAGILSAIVALGWLLDRRAARRREDSSFELGRVVERGFGRLTQHEKDMMLADVMASHHERKRSPMSDREWNWYAIGTFIVAVALMIASALVWVSM